MIFELPHPISTNKLWRHIVVGRRARRIASQEATDWKEAATMIARYQQGKEPMICGPFKAEYTLYPKRGHGYDLDNVVKLASDTLQGIAYENDRDMDVLIVQRGEKRPEGGLTVEITPLTDD